MVEHRDDPGLLPRSEAAFDCRLAQLINADVANPPSYLLAVGAPPEDSNQLGKWREAAALIA